MSIVSLDQLFHNGQPDASTTMLTGPGFLTPVESFKNEREIFLREFSTGIGEDDLHLPCGLLSVDSEKSSCRSLLRGILQEVGHGLGHLIRISKNPIRAFAELGLSPNFF
jgi:hypothetical protein